MAGQRGGVDLLKGPGCPCCESAFVGSSHPLSSVQGYFFSLPAGD